MFPTCACRVRIQTSPQRGPHPSKNLPPQARLDIHVGVASDRGSSVSQNPSCVAKAWESEAVSKSIKADSKVANMAKVQSWPTRQLGLRS